MCTFSPSWMSAPALSAMMPPLRWRPVSLVTRVCSPAICCKSSTMVMCRAATIKAGETTFRPRLLTSSRWSTTVWLSNQLSSQSKPKMSPPTRSSRTNSAQFYWTQAKESSTMTRSAKMNGTKTRKSTRLGSSSSKLTTRSTTMIWF